MSDENDNVVDLAAFRKQKEDEEAEKIRLEKEAVELEEIEHMRYLLGNIMEQLGDPTKTGSLFYVPMTDEDYNNYYTFESGYNEDGYYESTWEWEGFDDSDGDEEDV
jgi:5,10-methylene-tetrahydrofolate dehydrogenase/methenyl tetrahydrofolate cyclohydrolase